MRKQRFICRTCMGTGEINVPITNPKQTYDESLNRDITDAKDIMKKTCLICKGRGYM